jgi:surface antigen
MKVKSIRRGVLPTAILSLLGVCSLFFASTVLAASYGTYLGQFNTVAAYSNGTVNYNSGQRNNVNGVDTGLKWQCVEFVRRYFYTIFGISPNGGNALDWYPNAASLGLDKYPNGGTTPPQVGDILCKGYTPGTPYGHVAIIKRVENNRVYTAQQNVSEDSTDLDKWLPLTVSNGTYYVGDSSIQGWLRKPSQPTQATGYWHPDGSLLLDDAGTVWLIENGKKRGIPNQWTFVTNGFNWHRVIKATSQELSCYTTDSALQPGTARRLVKSSNGTIYMITDRGYKRGFTSSTAFEGLGYSWGSVAAISDSELALYPDDPAAPVLTSPLPDGTLIKTPVNGTIYVITNGKKRGITSGTAFQNMGYDWGRVVTVQADVFNTIGEAGPPIDDNRTYQCQSY